MTIGSNVHLLPQTDLLRALHTTIRDHRAPTDSFVLHSRRIIRLLLEAGMDLLPYDKRDVTTPVGETYHGLSLPARLCAVPVIRAGEAMEAELREMQPGIPVGKILIQRDKVTKRPRLFYSHLPADISTRHVFLLEPMLATGGSAMAAVEVLLDAGVEEPRIVLISLLASPDGLRGVADRYPRLQVLTSSVEDRMNDQAYMIPGIGDFGDRFFGTTTACVDCGGP